ncbi:hypothetical protein CEXT_82121 [Caerostris extrusa]|uniref:Uncharacterized protein n=1 Tax=Caerostris extrusa TaxID=172846 RepID=A0AAV4YDJ2_CAEEX|nr:hypothetical protein CEXT_82121 [Caerostris extrusa]
MSAIGTRSRPFGATASSFGSHVRRFSHRANGGETLAERQTHCVGLPKGMQHVLLLLWRKTCLPRFFDSPNTLRAVLLRKRAMGVLLILQTKQPSRVFVSPGIFLDATGTHTAIFNLLFVVLLN